MKLKFAHSVALILVIISLIGIGAAYQKSILEKQKRTTLRMSGEAPVALLSETEFDWGKIPRDQAVTQDFTLANTGARPLEITKLVTSCGCTTAKLIVSGEPVEIPFVIQSGQSVLVRVVFDPSLHDSRGITKRAVRIETNDPENPFLIINLRSDVQ